MNLTWVLLFDNELFAGKRRPNSNYLLFFFGEGRAGPALVCALGTAKVPIGSPGRTDLPEGPGRLLRSRPSPRKGRKRSWCRPALRLTVFALFSDGRGPLQRPGHNGRRAPAVGAPQLPGPAADASAAGRVPDAGVPEPHTRMGARPPRAPQVLGH